MGQHAVLSREPRLGTARHTQWSEHIVKNDTDDTHSVQVGTALAGSLNQGISTTHGMVRHTLDVWRGVSLSQQKASQRVQSRRSPANLREARSKMKWHRRTSA